LCHVTPIATVNDAHVAVAEYLKGLDSSDARGQPYTHRACAQTLFLTLGPNSTVPDRLTSYWCPNKGAANEPSMNLPCEAGDANNDNYASPRSRHPGGVNAAFCDGSVHFISDSIDVTNVWRPCRPVSPPISSPGIP
jgi:prepilin-type processing-associated H-X9-DG protein